MTTRVQLHNYLPPAAAGRRFNPPITAARVKQLEGQGLLRSIRVAGMRLYDPADVDRLVAEREQRSAERRAVK